MAQPTITRTQTANGGVATAIIYDNGTSYVVTANPDGTAIWQQGDAQGNPTSAPMGGSGVVNPDGSATFTAADGNTMTWNPDGSSVTAVNGAVERTNPDGSRQSVTDPAGNPLSSDQINKINNANGGTIGNGGLFGLGTNPVAGATNALGGLAQQFAGAITPKVPAAPPLDTSGAQSTVANTQSIANYLANAAKNQTPGVAPTITAVQTAPQTFATVPTAAPVAVATPGQVGGVMQVVAPTIGAAPTAGGASASGGVAQGYDATGYLAQAGQAETQYLDTVPQSQFRDTQQSLIGSLQDTIAGKTPSVADLQLRDAEQRQAANQLGVAAAASGGGNSPLAMRTAANNIALLNQAAASSGALLRAQEIATAEGQLGTAADQARTSDINIADRNATLGTGTNVSNAGYLTQANIASANNLTSASQASAQNKTSASIATAGDATQASVASANNATAAAIANANNATSLLAKQAELEYDASHDNAGNLLSASETNAKLLSDANLANALAQNTQALQTQKLGADASTTNANNATTIATNNAKFLNDANTNNATNFLGQETINERAQNDANTSWINANGQVITGQGNILSAQAQNNATNEKAAEANATNTLNTYKAAGQGAAWLLSDRRAKTDISDGGGDAQDLLNALSARSFRYKDPSKPGASAGRQTGVMAQDVERAPAGRAFVRDTPTGKKLDPAAGFGTVLSMLARLNDRMNEKEGRRAA